MTEMTDREKRIRERAHQLWIDEGRPQGREEELWQMARELVAQEQNQELATEPNPIAGGQDSADSEEDAEPLKEAVQNQGEFPTLTDQGEEENYPEARPRSRPPRRW